MKSQLEHHHLLYEPSWFPLPQCFLGPRAQEYSIPLPRTFYLFVLWLFTGLTLLPLDSKLLEKSPYVFTLSPGSGAEKANKLPLPTGSLNDRRR